MGPAVQAAATARPMMPLKPSLLRMGLDPETVPAANDAIEGEPCIEDEAIEECVLAEWPAGQLKVRPLSPRARRAADPVADRQLP